MLHELLKEIYKFEDNQVKPHHATGTRWIAHKLEITYKMLDKYGLYMQHFNSIIVDTSKQIDKVADNSQMADILIFNTLFFDLLDPAKISSLKT